MSFWEELRRRKVVRTTIAYLAGALVAAQVLDLLVGALDLPRRVLTIAVVVLIALLPVVIAVAWLYDASGRGLQRTGSAAAPIRWKLVLPLALIAVALVGTGLFFTLRKQTTALDANLVAVLPFRVSGSDIDYLSQGMVDLLAAKLTGEGGPRAADPRAIMSAQQQVGDDPNAIARAIGAGQVLVGSVVGTARQITLNATLADVLSGKSVKAELIGSTDTLPALIDHLAAQLLSLSAGEGQRLTALTSTSLPALRSYLTAQAAYRSARFDVAVKSFARAVQIDSTFALAAMGHVLSSGWGMFTDTLEERSKRLLGAHLDRLGAVDRAMAIALVGDGFPDRRSVKQKLAAWEAALELAPERSDAWFLYGDNLAHHGKLAERFDNLDVAMQAFHRSLQLDSAHIPALVHLIDFAMMRGEADSLKRFTAIWNARQLNDRALSHNYIARMRTLGDSAGLRAVRAGLDTASMHLLSVVALTPFVFGGAPDDAITAIEVMHRNAALRDEKVRILDVAHILYLAFGMPSKAVNALQQKLALQPADSMNVLSLAVLDALYGDGDEAFAKKATAVLEQLRRRADADRQLEIGCTVEQWKLWRKQPADARGLAKRLTEVAAAHPQHENAQLCARLLLALDANLRNRPDARARLSELDNFLKDGPAVDETLLTLSNSAAARLWDRSGDHASALRAITRNGYSPAYALFYNTKRREEARLAALNGQTQRAIGLYQSYLEARSRAEPSLHAQDNTVRRELARLAPDRN